MERDNTRLKIEVWDSETLGRGTFLGQLTLSFWSLIRLHDGVFTFSLHMQEQQQQATEPQTVRGSITIRLRISFPYWDCVLPQVRVKYDLAQQAS